jgi:hypothetical protein
MNREVPNKNSLRLLDDFISKEFKQDNDKKVLQKNYSYLDLKNNYTVNTDSDILIDYQNNITLHIKRNGEFLSLSDTKTNHKTVINLFDLFNSQCNLPEKKSKGFFKKLFS